MIPFIKMHANGNDFMIIDKWYCQNTLPPVMLIREWADRHTGVGFDQLLCMTCPLSSKADIYCYIFNADGSEVGQCGHGLACLASFLRSAGYVDKRSIRIETNTGVWVVNILKDHSVSIALGMPTFLPERMPFLVENPATLYQISFELSDTNLFQCIDSLFEDQKAFLMRDSSLTVQWEKETRDLKAQINRKRTSLLIFPLGLGGNPHCVVPLADLDKVPKQLGALLSQHPRFPKQCNVEFVQFIHSSSIKLRMYERGVGENRACGSGACASVIAGRVLKKLDAQVAVCFPHLEHVEVTYLDQTQAVQLTTSTHHVFEGKLKLFKEK